MIQFLILLALFSTTAFVVLWFWVVRKTLKEKKRMLDAALTQLNAAKKQLFLARGSPQEWKAEEILQRSQFVYDQSRCIYQSSLKKPWNAIPAFFWNWKKYARGEKNHEETID